jgi:hypothetical protein
MISNNKQWRTDIVVSAELAFTTYDGNGTAALIFEFEPSITSIILDDRGAKACISGETNCTYAVA